MLRFNLAALLLVVLPSAALHLPSSGRPVSRRDACLGAACAPFVLGAALPASADQVSSTRAGFKNPQQSDKPLTFAELLQKSIDQKEAVLGMSISPEELKALEEKVRKLYPGVK